MSIRGDIAQVQLDGIYYPPGGVWSYNSMTNETNINVNPHTLIFISWNQGPVIGSKLYLTGVIFGATANFNPLILFITSPPTATVSEIGLFNTNGLLYDKIFSPPLSVTADINFTIPYKFNDTNSGAQTYTAEAVVNSASNSTIVISNYIPLYFGSFTPGNLSLNYTNGITAPYNFVRTNVNSTFTDLDVYYPSDFNSTCQLLFNTAQTNKTYYNLPTSHAQFKFEGGTNDVVSVNCFNENGNETGQYVLTQSQSSFPLVQQIQNLRAGNTGIPGNPIGTLGKFGAFDMVTLIALILSIIGFNRVNEAVGAVFNVALIGVLSYFGIIQWPIILSSGVALIMVLVISSTRKTQGF